MPEFLQDKLRVFIVPTDILKVDLDIYEKMVYIVLRSFCNGHDNAVAFPSYKTIAELSSMSRAKAITVVQSLIDKGLISKEIRWDVSKNRKIRNTSNLYTLETPTLTQGSLQHRPPLVYDVDQPQSTAWTTPSPQRRPEKTTNKKQDRKNKVENNNKKATLSKSAPSKSSDVGSNDTTSVVVASERIKDFLAEKKMKVNKNTLTKWLQLADENTVIAAIEYTLNKSEVKTVAGYVTRILQAGFTPDLSTVDNNDLPEWITKQEVAATTEELTPEQKKQAADLLRQLGEIE